MKTNHKTILITLLIGIFVLNSAACSGTQKTVSGSTSTAETKPSKIVYVTLGDTATDFVKKAAESFKATNNVEVDIQNYPFADAHTKLVTMIEAGTPPDLSYGVSEWLGEFVARDCILPINDLATKEFQTDIYDSVWNLMQIGTTRWAVPYFMSDWALYINKDIFASKGVAVPATIDEMVAAAKKLNNPPESYGYGLLTSAHKNQFEFYFDILLPMGGKLISDDGKTVAFNDANGVNALKTYAELAKYSQAGSGAGDIYDVTNAFKAGKIAMCASNPRLGKELIDEKYKFNYEIVPMPKGIKSATLGVMDVHYIYKTPNSKTAMAFLEHYYKVENVLPAWVKYNFIPNSKTLAANEYYKTNKLLKVFIEAVPTAEYKPTVSAWPAIELILRDAIAKVCVNGEDPKTVLDAAAVEANKLLAAKQ